MKKISLFDVSAALISSALFIIGFDTLKRNEDKIKASADQVVDNVLAKLHLPVTRTPENRAIEGRGN